MSSRIDDTLAALARVRAKRPDSLASRIAALPLHGSLLVQPPRIASARVTASTTAKAYGYAYSCTLEPSLLDDSRALRITRIS